jgi:predicted O-methyltransferase YrrM
MIQLYQRYRTDLEKVRTEQSQFYRSRGYLADSNSPLSQKIAASFKRLQGFLQGRVLLKPQLDDIEAELTYLLIREFKPETIVEISPCGGWSSTWILKAIRDNGRGHLYSFDLIDDSVKNIPQELAKGRRTFVQGKIQENLNRLPQKIDYLFIDSDHSAEFADWYLKNLLPRIHAGTPVSVHDVFHTADPSGFDSEGGVVMKWLADQKLEYFTASPAKNPEGFHSISHTKETLGLHQRIHRATYNSMIYFVMSRSGQA